MGIEFDKDLLAVEQNTYSTKIVNLSFVCELDVWSKVLLNIFKLKT